MFVRYLPYKLNMKPAVANAKIVIKIFYALAYCLARLKVYRCTQPYYKIIELFPRITISYSRNSLRNQYYLLQ